MMAKLNDIKTNPTGKLHGQCLGDRRCAQCDRDCCAACSKTELRDTGYADICDRCWK